MTTRPPHDDPGRNLPRGDADTPTDTNNQQQYTIVKVGTHGAEKVQLTGRVRFPFSEQIVKQLRECVRGEGSTIGTNGKARHVAQDGGLLRHPSGNTKEGTTVDAFPILLVDKEHADAIAKKLSEALDGFSAKMKNVVSLGLVADGQREILDMVTRESREAYERTHPTMRTELRLITGDESDEPAATETAVELNHEATHRDDQQGEVDGTLARAAGVDA